MAFTSMAGASVAKSLMAVTIAMHPASAHHHHGSHTITVRRGDTLSSITKRAYGHASRWPALWWVNRHRVHNPQMIRVGERLTLSDWHPVKPWITKAALGAIPVPRQAPAPAAVAAPVAAAAPAAAPAPAPAAGSYSGAAGSYQSCVIASESGGNASAVNSATGAGGLYGFLPSTWQALGYSGLPQNAPVSVQNAAFAKQYAQSGASSWSPYDGC
jgi:resuscitation-promoting factor RpfC